MPRSRRTADHAWKERFDAFLNGPMADLISRVFIVTVILVACVIGLRRLESWVTLGDTKETATGEIRIQWADVPQWLHEPENRHIFDDLVTCTGLTTRDRLTDPSIPERVGRALADAQVGWIRRVNRIEKHFPARLVVHCDFREPVAWVHFGPNQYLVDAEGVRLPGRYAESVASDSGLLDILGASAAPPPVGSAWEGDDIRAALAVARAVDHQPFSEQITGVNIENYGMRLRRDRPHIELLTDRAGSRIWWGRAPGEEDSTEISADQKVALMMSMYQRWGRVDMNRNYVDVTTWTDKVALPAAEDPSEPTLRG